MGRSVCQQSDYQIVWQTIDHFFHPLTNKVKHQSVIRRINQLINQSTPLVKLLFNNRIQ